MHIAHAYKLVLPYMSDELKQFLVQINTVETEINFKNKIKIFKVMGMHLHDYFIFCTIPNGIELCEQKYQ